MICLPLQIVWGGTFNAKFSLVFTSIVNCDSMNEKRKNPYLIQPRKNAFERSLSPKASKDDTQTRDTFIKNVDNKEEWDEMLQTRSKMTVIEVILHQNIYQRI